MSYMELNSINNISIYVCNLRYKIMMVGWLNNIMMVGYDFIKYHLQHQHVACNTYYDYD